MPTVTGEGLTRDQALGKCLGMWAGRNKVSKEELDELVEDIKRVNKKLDRLNK